ncbi:MAG: stage III sporulation protein AE [Oscillospiraceae bacterium]|nr:stage III sporulation protein AE [Oscillospiraceae bacterium]
MNNTINYAYDETLSELLQVSGTQELLESFGLDQDMSSLTDFTDPANLTALQFQDFMHEILDSMKNQVYAPLQMLGLCIGIILLSALSGCLHSQKKSISRIYDIISVLCAASAVIAPMTEIFLRSAQILEKTADFMLVFSSIFGAILGINGNLTASAGYQGAIVMLCSIALEISVKLLFPFLTMSLAMGLVDAVNPEIALSGMIQLLRKVTVWILGFLMALFLGFLSVQSIVASSADKLSTKAIKYTISGFVPFVGGAISDAYSAVLGSMDLLKSATGMIGILAVLALLLPVLTELFLYKTVAAGAAAIAELFSASGLAGLFRNLESVLSVSFSISVSFSVMFIVSTGIMTALGNGG